MSNYRKQIDTTEELAKWYDEKYTSMGDGWMTPADECNRHLDDLGVPFDQNLTLLDIGCGAGHFLAEASKRVKTTGLEISIVGINHCARRASHAFLVLSSIENIIQSGTLYPSSFDFITSIGSLEHIVHLDKALDNIRLLLAPLGKFYFYCPNELWQHFDQPNERTMTSAEWIALFASHGLYVHTLKRWNDNTTFIGTRTAPNSVIDLTPKRPSSNKINAGSGQQPFDRGVGWINIDINAKWSPDLVGDWNDLSIFEDNSIELVVSHHSLEHVGCGEGDGFIREAHRVLKPGGSLLVFVPDMRALAERWLTGQIDEQRYMTNVFGAFMGDEADRHKWGWSREGLWTYLKKFPFKDVHAFNWRTIPGADIANDWWIIGLEAIK